jgi:PAS domain S-box-containing protein
MTASPTDNNFSLPSGDTPSPLDPLAIRERQYLATKQALQEGIIIQQANGEVITRNQTAEKILGLTVDQIAGRAAPDPRRRVVQADGLPLAAEAQPMATVFRTGQAVQNVVMGIYQPNGDLTWGSVNAEPIFYTAAATPEAVVATFVDITPHKQQAEALRYTETRYRALFENILDAVYVLSPHTGRILDCNPAAARMTGYTVAELKQMTVYDLHPPATRTIAAAKLREVIKNGSIPELSGIRHRRKDGELVPVEISANRLRLGDDEVIMAVVHDVTRRQKTETALKESEERFNLAIQGSNDGLWDWDLTTNEVYYSPRWKSMLGYDDHELAHHLDTWQRLLHPDDNAQAWEKFNAYMAGHSDRLEIEFRMRHKAGHWVNILSRAFKQFDVQGQPVRLVGTHVDLTPLRQIENQLRYAQEIARLGYYVFNIETGDWTSSAILDNIFDIDHAYQRDVPGWLDLIHPDFQEIMAAYLAEEILTEHHPFDKEYKIITANSGQERWVHGMGELAFNEAGQLIRMFGTIQDITPRKLAEEARRQTEDRYQGIFETIAASITIVDRHGVILDVNRHHLSHISKGQKTKANSLAKTFWNGSASKRRDG